jgi:hypothetical protein
MTTSRKQKVALLCGGWQISSWAAPSTQRLANAPPNINQAIINQAIINQPRLMAMMPRATSQWPRTS